MSKAYEDTKGSLADRLMAALIAGDLAGGDHRGRLAAGIRVAKKDVDGYWLEVQVDRSDDAVIDLARKYAELKHEAKGEWRGGQLPFEVPAQTVKVGVTLYRVSTICFMWGRRPACRTKRNKTEWAGRASAPPMRQMFALSVAMRVR